MSEIPGGSLHDVNAFAKHFYYDARRKGEDPNLPLIFMGVVSVAIGATMIYHGGKKLWADHAKEQAKGRGQ